MWQWLGTGQQGEESDSEQEQRVTRSGRLSEKSRQEAIQKQETEKLGRTLRKKFKEAGDKLERDQQPQQGPSGQQQAPQLPTPETDKSRSENTPEVLTGAAGGSGG